MYIDTSALVAYYLPEKKSDIAQNILTGPVVIQISQLTETEILSAFKKKVRVGEIDIQKSDEAYHIFQNQKKQHTFEILKLTDAAFKSSQIILKTTSAPLRTLDALHLGIIYEYELELFSFDNVLIKAAKEFNIATVEI